MAKVCITNELARIVALVSDLHPKSAIGIEWREVDDPRIWIITAESGFDDYVYIADDEQGAWAPAIRSELDAIEDGEPLPI